MFSVCYVLNVHCRTSENNGNCNPMNAFSLFTVTTVQTGFDQTISSLDNQQRVGQNEVTTAMKLLKKCSGCEYFTK